MIGLQVWAGVLVSYLHLKACGKRISLSCCLLTGRQVLHSVGKYEKSTACKQWSRSRKARASTLVLKPKTSVIRPKRGHQRPSKTFKHYFELTVCSMSRATLVCLIVFVILLMAGLIAGIIVGITRDDIGLKRDRYGSREYHYINASNQFKIHAENLWWSTIEICNVQKFFCHYYLKLTERYIQKLTYDIYWSIRHGEIT